MLRLINLALQHIVPQHGLSRVMYHLARCRWRWFKCCLINGFIRLFQIDMQRAKQEDPGAYPHFNAFFTREFKRDIQQAAAADIYAPVDAQISQIGKIDDTTLLQAKGRYYQLNALLADAAAAASRFVDGSFTTLYLSPRDYHRIHMPRTGRLHSMIYVPGRLFSVDHSTVRTLDNLFTRNERLICLFDTDIGSMAVIMVGAIFVGNMETVWHGEIMSTDREIQRWRYRNRDITLKQGQEMGRFNMGSTVILLFEKNKMHWASSQKIGQKVHVGQAIGQCEPDVIPPTESGRTDFVSQ